MTNQETNLHPKNNPSINLKPNIVTGNIPDKAVTFKQLDENLQNRIELNEANIDKNTADISSLREKIDDKTIPLFGKHSILVPKDSADTNILPCTPSDNGKVLSVVNGEAQWANVGGGSGGEGGISVIELTDKNGTIATAQLDEINANPQNFAFKYNGKILLFTSADSTTYQYCNNTTSSSDNSVMTTSTLLTITSSTGAYTIAKNVHNVVANSIHPANGGNLTNIQVGTKVYSIPSGTIIFTHDSTEYTISIPLKEYALGDTITLNEYPLTPKEFFSTISFYAIIDNVIEITGVKFLITYNIFKFGLRTIATCIKSGTVTENKVYKLSYTYATR